MAGANGKAGGQRTGRRICPVFKPQSRRTVHRRAALQRKDYAAAHGYTIVHEYVDRAKSGRTDNRAEFQQMLKDTAKRQFSVIILWKVDRFGRNREEIAINKMKCRKNGVRVE